MVTLRDAAHTAMHFDIFNRHADKVAMANVAQTINCLHSLFLATEDSDAENGCMQVLRGSHEMGRVGIYGSSTVSTRSAATFSRICSSPLGQRMVSSSALFVAPSPK